MQMNADMKSFLVCDDSISSIQFFHIVLTALFNRNQLIGRKELNRLRLLLNWCHCVPFLVPKSSQSLERIAVDPPPTTFQPNSNQIAIQLSFNRHSIVIQLQFNRHEMVSKFV